MLGDSNYRRVIREAIEGIRKDIEPSIHEKDEKTIHLQEVTKCLRRSYFDRVNPKEIDNSKFLNLMSGLLHKTSYGAQDGEYTVGEIKLLAKTDMIIDDLVFVFHVVPAIPSNPYASDLLYLNACLWIFDKFEGIIIYLTPDGAEESFSLSRDKKMFEETIRRVKVLSNLLSEQKKPILEPSQECNSCQYYEDCFIKKKKSSSSISLEKLIGMKSNNT